MPRGKAVFTGECQVCGHRQKLPGRRLSLHGYTKKWSCFVGICPGARHEAWEESCEMAKQAILQARANVTANEAFRASLEAIPDAMKSNAETATAWMSIYRSRDYRRQMVEVQIRRTNITMHGGQVEVKWEYLDPFPEHGRDAVWHAMGINELSYNVNRFDSREVVRHLNSRKVSAISLQIAHLEEYIRWQEARVASWTPQPLKAIA